MFLPPTAPPDHHHQFAAAPPPPSPPKTTISRIPSSPSSSASTQQSRGRSADPENCAMLCLLLLHDMGFRENHLQQRRKGRPKPRPQKIRGERNECAPVTLCFTRCNALQPSPIPVKFGLGARDEAGDGVEADGLWTAVVVWTAACNQRLMGPTKRKRKRRQRRSRYRRRGTADVGVHLL